MAWKGGDSECQSPSESMGVRAAREERAEVYLSLARELLHRST